MLAKQELKKEISFKVSADTYTKYKRYCDEQRVIPAADLRRYIAEKAAASNGIFDGRVSFLALNMHMKNTDTYNVSYEGDEDHRIDEIAGYVTNEAPDVACLSEFMPTEKGKRLAAHLEHSGYKIYYPVKKLDYDDCKRYWCVTILAIKKDSGLKFDQIFSADEMFPRFRYVAGVLSKGDSSNGIMIAGVHVPCVDDDTNEFQVSRKVNSLVFLKGLKDTYSHKEVLYFGDFNETFNGGDIFGGMVDVTQEKATWDEYGIDKFIATPNLALRCTCSLVDDSPRIRNLTDHCAIKMVKM
ncbi:MAG: endonuclease/exonuclease/phosphatase family protein [Lachnospiraceae bacterium]|nr:endonuclease/exonuclease/phosphatase family protein [Lachnospiraceae bacterium]